MTSQSAIEDLIYNLTVESGATPLQQEALKTAAELDLLLFIANEGLESEKYTEALVVQGRKFLRKIRRKK